MKSPTERLIEIMATKLPEFSLVELYKHLTSAGIKDVANTLLLPSIYRIGNELVSIY